MAGTSIMVGICRSLCSFSYPIEKVWNSPYPYPINAEFFYQNGDKFGQYWQFKFICHL